MPNESMKIFYDEVERQDREEAERVNAICDQLIMRGANHSHALQRANEEAELELAPEVLGADKFGLRTARNAARWWMYKTAYLHQADQMQAEWLNFYRLGNQDAGDKLLKQDETYILFYDLLERNRVKSQRWKEDPDDPFEVEFKSIFLLLPIVEKVIRDRHSTFGQELFPQYAAQPG
jgi:hypothetical protein